MTTSTKIFLYGPPGCGKSTLGRLLAGKLGLSFLDLDAEIVRNAGQSIPEIMAAHGELAFRDLETAALETATTGEAGVIALGGGALLRDENRARAETSGTVVCLDANLETLLSRLHSDENGRPLLAGDVRARLTTLLDQRRAHYASFPLYLDTAQQDAPQSVWQLQIALGRFCVSGMGQPYDVVVEVGGLGQLGELLRERQLDGPVAVVTESNVGPLYAERAANALRKSGYETSVVRVPAGEAAKNIETVMTIWRGLLQGGLDRRSTVVALGGGVIGDMAGFAAASFMRGIRWVGVPTSLLSMVDASLGGKTGFDLPEGKNLVGAFHPPSLVLADPQLLSTLPEAELRSGLAEVVKHGIISDPGLFDLCAAGYESVKENLATIVRRAMAVKIAIIETDPYERGMRAALNLGHTVGHAVELVSGFQLRHGEAIAIGTVVEARLAERLGLAVGGLSEELGVALSDLGLPTHIPPGMSQEAIINAMKMDKKKAAGVVKFALPVKVGQVEVGVAIENLSLVFEQ